MKLYQYYFYFTVVFVFAGSILFSGCSGSLAKSESISKPPYNRPRKKSPKRSSGDNAIYRNSVSFPSDEGDEEDESEATSASIRGRKGKKTSGKRISRTPSESGLRAGFENDNKQFNYFLGFLKKHRWNKAYQFAISERIIIKVKDSRGKSLPNCRIKIYTEDDTLVYKGKTYADGSYLFFPGETGYTETSFKGVAKYKGRKKTFYIDRSGKREVTVRFNIDRGVMQNVPLDIVFIMDTTGSMGEEIQRLKSTIDIIHLNVSNFSSKPDVRFGMVLYRDKGDEYRTKTIPFTSDLDEFKAELDKVEAGGGGDIPEDLQEALRVTMKSMKWRKNGIRLAYIITDAYPHLDYGQTYNYVEAAKEAKAKAIKIFSIGTGGLDSRGEYVLRQIAQYTSGNYIFLHYGEKGESGGGKVGAVSHHTGANYQVSKLETLLIRLTKIELSYLTNQPVKEEREFFLARKVGDDDKDRILKELFSKAVGQLVDYSSIRLKKRTSAAVVTISSRKRSLKADAEYFTEQLAFSMSRNKTFKLIERGQLQKIVQEQHLQGSALFDERKTVKLGKLVGAKLLVLGKLYKRKGRLEMIFKLVRVKTGEILSISRVKVDKRLRS